MKKEALRIPKFYGSVTVGERGQIVIPTKARRDFNIESGGQILVLSGLGNKVIMLVKSESLTDYMANITAKLQHFEKILQSEPKKRRKSK